MTLTDEDRARMVRLVEVAMAAARDPERVGPTQHQADLELLRKALYEDGPHLAALLSAARQARTQGPGEGLDEPTRWLLRYVDASGGKVSASEYRGNPIDLWCDDRGQETDTLNVAIEDGLLSCSHNSDTDESWVWITDAGRRALPAPPASQTQEP